MPRISAGLLLFHWSDGELHVLLGHPGGPYYNKKDDGNWTIPKGLVESEEDLLMAARREFAEETGLEPPDPASGDCYLDLGEMRYKNGKRVHAWAFEGECNPDVLVSNSFEIEWPPRSGEMAEFPEIDRFGLFDMETAVVKAHPAQLVLLQRLVETLSSRLPT